MADCGNASSYIVVHRSCVNIRYTSDGRTYSYRAGSVADWGNASWHPGGAQKHRVSHETSAVASHADGGGEGHSGCNSITSNLPEAEVTFRRRPAVRTRCANTTLREVLERSNTTLREVSAQACANTCLAVPTPTYITNNTYAH